jgi:hypothetical protein
MLNKRYKVIYIAGNGHSGSTLLDIILGNGENCFSAGELSCVVRKGLQEEFCSCNSKISDCKFWRSVFDIWAQTRPISFEKYCDLRHNYERNATFLRTWFNVFFPSEKFKQYRISTSLLFDAIHQVSGASIIIDSSKSPQRIAILRGIVDLQVIHLCREFKGVLNSAKQSIKKDIAKGIEADSHPRRTDKTLFDWVLTNALCSLFTFGINSKKLKYKDYIQKPECLIKFNPAFAKIGEKEFFSASHMLAGNHLRLSKNIKIVKDQGFSYKRLSKSQLTFSGWVDRIFWFWH